MGTRTPAAPSPRLSAVRAPARVYAGVVLRVLPSRLSFLLPVTADWGAAASEIFYAEFLHAPLARLLLPFPPRPCGVFVAAGHSPAVAPGSVVSIYYISVVRFVRMRGFGPNVKSMSADAGCCKQSISTVRVSGTPRRRVAAPTASASIVPCWTLFPREVGDRGHIFSVLCMSRTLGKMRIAPFGAWPRTDRAPANMNTQSIAGRRYYHWHARSLTWGTVNATYIMLPKCKGVGGMGGSP